MEKIRAVAIVAHPDDCVIFASAYMDAHPEYDWSILYLTHWRLHKRGREMARYWKKRGVKTRFLGFKDHGRDLGTNSLLTWSKADAIRTIRKHSHDYDLILTHNAIGEYGHPHHRVVYEATKDYMVSMVYFSLDPNDLTYKHNINLEELPRHRKSIEIHAASGYSHYMEFL